MVLANCQKNNSKTSNSKFTRQRKRRDTIEIFLGSCQGVKALLADDPFLLPPPGTFFGVPSLVSNAENYWLIKEGEEKIRQIILNLPDFSGCKDRLFETLNCWSAAAISQLAWRKRERIPTVSRTP
jgi:hypothetical protein